MPDSQLTILNAVDVVEHPRERRHAASDPDRGSRLLIYVSLALIAAFFTWASVFQLDQSVGVDGQVIASERTQDIQAAQTGVLKKLMVKEGDAVKAGQLIAIMDSDRQQAAVDDGRVRMATLQLTIARLRAELGSAPLLFDSELAKEYPLIAVAQRDLYVRLTEALHDETKTLNEALALADQELQMNAALLASGDISQADVLRLKRQTVDLRAQIANRRNKFFQDAQAELAKYESDLASQRQQLTDRESVLAQSEVRSPVDGFVNTIRAYTQGAVVREGEGILQILPSASELVVEAKLRPADVAMVSAGMPATIKFDAFDYTIYGMLKGTVRYISPDAINLQTARGDAPYYRVLVAVSKQQLGSNRKIELRPGMAANVSIRSGRRTVLQYLTKPISKVMNESLTEK